MNFSRKKFAVIAAALIPMIAANCSEPPGEGVHNAQACLDAATAATAQTCYNMVNGNTTAAASLIRCAAILIQQGYGNPTTLQNALTSLQSGSNPNANAMNFLAFRASAGAGNPSNATDVVQANLASTQCAASGSTGLSMLGMFAGLATIISQSAGAQTGAGFLAIANSQGSTIANQGNNAASMQTAYQQNCTGSISGANQSFCTQYSAAMVANPGGSAAVVGAAFLTNLK